MTSSDMQDTPAGRRAAGADGPRSSQPKRRTFTAAYKLAVIEKYDAAAEPGAKGALLRGEGLYDSHISYWRKARDSGALTSAAAAVPAVAHKGRPGMAAENERLRKRLAKAEVKLSQNRAALDIMGKGVPRTQVLLEVVG
jgi:transposase-like protein